MKNEFDLAIFRGGINRLNCMNYIVDNGEEHYYLQCGIESLVRFADKNNIDLAELLGALLQKRYFTLSDGQTEIQMI